MHCCTSRALGNKQSAAPQAVYLYSKTDSSWRGRTTFSSIASNQRCPARGVGGVKDGSLSNELNHTLSLCKNKVRKCLQEDLFVEPPPDDHGTVGVSSGGVASFPKCLHLAVALLSKQRNHTLIAKNRDALFSMGFLLNIEDMKMLKQTLTTGKYEMVATLDAWLILSWSSILRQKQNTVTHRAPEHVVEISGDTGLILKHYVVFLH